MYLEYYSCPRFIHVGKDLLLFGNIFNNVNKLLQNTIAMREHWIRLHSKNQQYMCMYVT